MDYFHWVGGTVLLLCGIHVMGLRIYVPGLGGCSSGRSAGLG